MMGTISHAGPVVGKIFAIDLVTARSRGVSYQIHSQPTELIR